MRGRTWRLLAAFAFMAALGVGAGLRVSRLSQELPYLYNPDETTNLHVIAGMVNRRELNPEFFHYPSLTFTLQAGLHLPAALSTPDREAVLLLPPDRQSQGNARTAAPDPVLRGRALTAAVGVATAALAGALGWLAAGADGPRPRGPGVRAAVVPAAALLLAVSPLAVRHSRVITVDACAGFFAAATAAAALWVLRTGSAGSYAVAGVCTGLAASSKYNAAVVAAGVLAAHVLRASGWRTLLAPRALLAPLAAIAAFLATTPYALLERTAFLADVRAEAAHYARGHVGAEGDALATSLGWLWAAHGPVLVAGLLASLLLLRRSWRPWTVLVVTVAAPLLLLGSFEVRFERNLTALLAPLLALAAWGLVTAVAAAGERTRVGAALLACAVVAGVALPLRQAAATVAASAVDERAPARAWIAAHVPAGSVVGVGSYAPYVDPERFRVRPVPVPDAECLAAAGPLDYLVLAEYHYGRYLAAADRYPAQAAAFRRALSSGEVAASWPEVGITVLRLADPRGGDAAGGT